jgi:hypothetical protein
MSRPYDDMDRPIPLGEIERVLERRGDLVEPESIPFIMEALIDYLEGKPLPPTKPDIPDHLPDWL